MKKLKLIATPQTLSKLLNIDTKHILEDIKNGIIPAHELEEVFFIPTRKLLPFIKLKKFNYNKI